MAEKHLEKCFTSLAIREIQIKTTLRFYLTPVRMSKNKNIDNSLCWRGCEALPLLVGVQTCRVTLEINMVISEKTGD